MTSAQFIDAYVALGLSAPGGLDPLDLTEPNPFTDLWYSRLPECYRQADVADTSTRTGFPLWAFMDAVASVLEEPLALGERIADGQLTDPALADDSWIPWLAQVAGVQALGLFTQRQQLANLFAAPPLGSRRYLEVLTQNYLTGTRYVQVTAAQPWGIQIRVRADEITGTVGNVDGLRAALYATGLIPAGFVLQVVTDQQTWAQVQAAVPTWAPAQGATWARVQSIGLAGSGMVSSGGVSWKGTAVGVRP